jgi:hypothetical protein
MRVRIPRKLSGNSAKVLNTLTSLLGPQQCIKRLRIEVGWLVVPALTALQTGVSQGKTLQSLDISVFPSLNRTECEYLSAAFISGAFPALAVLQTRGKSLTDEELGCFVAAIRAGAFRQLRELILAAEVWYCKDNVTAVTELMGALEAGGCPMLTKLSLTCCRIDQTGYAALERAVRGGSLSSLQTLELKHSGWGRGPAAGLVRALAEEGCPSLQALDLSLMRVMEGEMLPLLEALSEGRVRHLRSLTLGMGQVARAGMVALSEALLQGQALEELSIHYPWSSHAEDPLIEQDYLLLVRQPTLMVGRRQQRR